MSEPKTLAQQIEAAIDQGATTVEQIHHAIADLPLSALERSGLFERTAEDVRSLQHASIGAVYSVVREINHEVMNLAEELLGGEFAESRESPRS